MSEPNITLCHGIVIDPMALRAWRRLEGSHPYTLECNGVEWALTVDELAKLTRAAEGIASALMRSRSDGKRPTPGRRYRASPRDGERVVEIELGIEAAGDADMFYFSFDGATVRCEINQGGDLLHFFKLLSDDVEALRALQPSLNVQTPPPGERWRTWRPRFDVDNWRPDGWT